MPVTTDPLTMSQAPSKEYLQGWNDCHKHMAEEIVRQDTQIEQYDLTIRGMTEKNDELREAGRKSADDAASALDLLSRIRFALGDNGTRMQDELLEYCRELRDSAGALAAMGDLGALILRELLALPPAVLNPPVFRKLQGHLENYRKHYVNR